ncbi:MAG TPA: alpha/beta hydrolase [Clostridia bacterium]|nr:alpha/beta hydrolase [Clostridia bacterium]
MQWYAILPLLLAISTVCGFYFSGIVIYPRTKSRETVLQKECEKGNMSWESFDRLSREEVRISSRYGYELHGYYFPNGSSKKTVIICHGITYTIFGSVKYMEMFMERGYNVLLYDHRNHGNSGGRNTTYGYYEKYDLMACTDWVFGKCGSDCLVGIHGESMGAAIALQNIAIDPRIAFCIADCSFSDLMRLFSYRLRVEFKLPPFPAMQITGLFVRLRAGMRFSDVSPIRDIADADTPVLFVHGKEDLYIPAQMSIDMYNSKKGIKKLYLAPDARHAEAVAKNREEYDRQVGEFLYEIGCE